jgi:phosphomevalonate kinase
VIAVTAPGKLFLTGEWAVLRGAPALVAAVDRVVRLEVDVAAGDGPLAIESLAEGRAWLGDAGATETPKGDRAPSLLCSLTSAGCTATSLSIPAIPHRRAEARPRP